jgi:hypothetical protein
MGSLRVRAKTRRSWKGSSEGGRAAAAFVAVVAPLLRVDDAPKLRAREVPERMVLAVAIAAAGERKAEGVGP